MGYYIPFLKALNETDGKTCPGELYCTSPDFCAEKKGDEDHNELITITVGGKMGKLQARTLENYCHDKPGDKDTRLLQGCILYPTKPNNISPMLRIAIDTAEFYRELHELDMLPTLEDISAYDFSCYKASERASRKVQNDVQRKMSKESKKGKTPDKIGGDTEALSW